MDTMAWCGTMPLGSEHSYNSYLQIIWRPETEQTLAGRPAAEPHDVVNTKLTTASLR